jgi:hypothetical protein
MKLHQQLLVAAVLGGIPFAILNAQVTIPASDRVGTTPGVGNGLNGFFWQRAPKGIAVDGNSNPANSITNQINSFGAPTGTFEAHAFGYFGNDLTPISTWLGGDAGTFTGPPSSNLDDGAFRFRGFLFVPTPGVLNFGLNSDDGSRMYIGSVELLDFTQATPNNDGSHGDQIRDVPTTFSAAGLYPFQVDYFNGDWTDAGGVNHGGANLTIRESGAQISEANLYRNVPEPSTVIVGLVTLGGMLALRRRRQ